MDTLMGMRLFTKVVEVGSFSAAGRQLGLAVSSVSRQVGALEEELGTRLLNRSTRSLGLTEAGGLYYERAGRIIADVDDANAAVSELTETPRGILRLNVPVVDDRTPEAIALAISDLFAHPPKREATRAYAEEFSWDATTKGQLNLFNAALRT
jgi:DNA-binding transcriptional LysR family regulator